MKQHADHQFNEPEAARAFSSKAVSKDRPEPAAKGMAQFLCSAWNRGWLFGLLLVVATFIAYAPAWNAGFVWDDDVHVTQNRLLWEPGGLKQIWFSLSAPQYYPLVFTSLRLEYALWGLNPAGYHWVNLVLHAISALLVWRVLQRLSVPGAWLAAAVFALHPVNVESVAWISQRKNALCMVFYLLSLLFYLRWESARELRTEHGGPKIEKDPPPSSILHPPSAFLYWLSLLSFVLALLSKTAVAPLPLLLLGLAWWRRGRVALMDLWRSAPFFGAAGILGLLTIWFEQLRNGAPGVIPEDGFWSQLAGAGWAVWFYLDKAALPLHLNYIYPQWHINPSDALSYVPGLLLVGMFLLFWRYRRGWGRPCLLCLGYYLVMLLPVLGFMNIGFLQYSHVADHWQYFAIIGPIALATGALCSRLNVTSSRFQLRACRLAALVILAVLFILTWQQSAWYVDEKTLWNFTLAENPSAWVARNNLGNALREKGQTDEAIRQYQEAIRLKPDYAGTRNNLGIALVRKGRTDEAISQYQEAFRLKPNYADAHYNLGIALVSKGQMDEAIRQYQEAIRLKPNYAEAHYNLGAALDKKGQTDEAIRHYQEALRLKPDYAEVHNNLGNAFRQKGQLDLAIAHFQRALEIQPAFPAAHNNLGNLLLQKGQVDEAIAHYQKALESSPDFANAHHNLATALVEKGRLAEGIAHFQRALELAPQLPEAQAGLADALLQSGQPAQAAAHYTEALRLNPNLPDSLNNLAWLRATSPLPELRDGPQAVQLAQRACELTSWKQTVFIGTLAAAYAQAGQFEKAVEAGQKACDLAGSLGQTNLLQRNQELLRLYREGRPVRE
ncbi:MAG: tetratricopeptide repeat protein [Verrucomicrobiota bacterium]